jgi:hypothetical protein
MGERFKSVKTITPQPSLAASRKPDQLRRREGYRQSSPHQGVKNLDADAHCLILNVTEQLLADDWGGVTESVRWPLWRERLAWARGARWFRR